MNKTRLLIVDDEADVRANLVEQFTDEEFEVHEASTGREAMDAVRSREIDLVVMDVGLPDVDGRDAVKAMRSFGFMAPVIMLSGFASDDDAIRGLESGAFDYVTKPFRFALLLAKVRTHARLWLNGVDSVARIGTFAFRFGTRELVDAEGVPVKLTEKEARILRHLLRAERSPVTRDTLLREVWGYNSGLRTHTLETHVYRLRRKIEADHSRPRYILTSPGGYRLVPEGTDVEEARAA